MLFKNITIIDENFNIRENMYVGILKDRIDCVSDKMPEKDYGEIYEGRNKLLIPAFYNAHSHLPMSYMRGYGENLSLMDWLSKKIFPFEAHLTKEDIYWSCLAGITEMLRYGIAGTTEMYLQQIPLCRALLESGVKADVSICVTCFDDSDYKDLYMYKDTLESLAEYGNAGEGRIHPGFSLHAEYTSNEKIARQLAETVKKYKSTMHVHVAETSSEVSQCRERHGGRSPVRYLHDCGIFDVPTTAAHCIHIDDDDIRILAEDKVTVATCPKSNLKLASGICPVSDLLKAGVNVAIGTDSVASNNNLNMIEEMRFFSLLQKVRSYDPTLITPSQTLYAATRASALSQGRTDCGFIKEGFKADLTVFDTDRPYMLPEHNLLNNLVYSSSGSDVVLTMADGKILYENGEYKTIDVERVQYETEKNLRRILGEMKS